MPAQRSFVLRAGCGTLDGKAVEEEVGVALRHQEVWGMRWMSLDEDFAWVIEVIYHGQLDEWGKTDHSAQRRTATPGILREDLSKWRETLRQFAQGGI
jgi:hypothetical protein